jgi:cobalt-zinc-cadmium efflux system outer membrane protein
MTSKGRPGGPTQYDINITYPLDVTHKRRARTEVACRAKKVLEAQYQDAVRVQIDNLYTAYVDVLAARETVRFARASAEGLVRIAEVTRTLKERGNRTEPDVERVQIQRNAAEIGLADAEEGLRRTKRTLALLLNLPPAAAGQLELRGSIRDPAPPPTGPELARLALAGRPDVAAYRLGMARAVADVTLARANRYADVYVMAQPYTFQNNAPFDIKSAHSWALGVTVPLPIYNRNQGNIERARINVTQTQTELVTLERQVVTEVEQAEQEYQVTRAAIARDLVPGAARLLGKTEQLYRAGEAELIAYLNAQRDYNDVVRQYRDTLVRHRRSMLRLNTTVGQRLLP